MVGYPHFAALLARFPECQMFRKFEKLSILMLLYRQAELVYLERDLEAFARFDVEVGDTRDIEKCWDRMRAAFQNNRALLQRDKIQEIQSKLKRYRKYPTHDANMHGENIDRLWADELLLQLAKINRLGKPAIYSHNLVTEWLSSSQGGQNFLDVFEATPWQAKCKTDLVALAEETNGLNRWLAQYLTPCFHLLGRFRKADTDVELGIGEIWEYKHSSFAKLGDVGCIALSCVVPLGSVFALFFVTQVLHRLLLIAAFTTIFATVLGFITACRRSEIFAATAAFVALQVIFLQGVMSIHQTT